tara:strand:- start:107321 stop:112435 length:5115 start_codon:yes stop_codon:yes gene_type:complete
MTFGSFSQTYGNEWIDYSQSYYKFPIVEDGIYRIDYSTLQSSGIPVSTISPNQLQVFGKEHELPLFVEDGGDNSFDPGDYIEFYAEGNDGWLDSLLYDGSDDIGNPAYSLYNDTLYYFFTWTNNGNGLRFVEETATNFTAFTPATYFWEEVFQSYSNRYYGGYSVSSVYTSYYSPGEGWGSLNYNGANDFTQVIPLSTVSRYDGTDAPNALFHAKSNANSNASFTGTGNHHLVWEVGSNNVEMHNEVFLGYRQTVVSNPFSPSELEDGTTNVFFKIIGDQGAATDYQSINYVSIEYPRTGDMDGADWLDLELFNSTNEAKIRMDLTNTSLSNPSAYVFGGDVPRKIPFVENSGTWQGLVPNAISTNRQKFVIQSASEIQSIGELAPVNGNGSFDNYSNLDLEEAYLLIYNKSMQTSASEYASYRSSPQGGGYNVVMCEIGDAWMQFGGGVPKHILSIRRFSNFVYNQSTEKPVALFLVGKGITEASDPNTNPSSSARKSAAAMTRNLVPSYGYPSSDVCITGKWNGSTELGPAIPTGRIAANNDTELQWYLSKIQTYEAAQNQSSIYNKPSKEWQKQILHFGGGANTTEQTLLKNYLNSMKQIIEGPDYGGNVTSYFKETSNPFNPVLSSEVDVFLENGVSLMTFFGHATAEGFDQSIDDPSDWGNTGKYPMVIGNGCYTGDIFKLNNNSYSEDFILIDNLGAIGFLSSTKLGFASALNTYSNRLYQKMSPDNYGATIGEQIQNTIADVSNGNSGLIMESTVTQMTLHGDPVMRLNWHALPEIDLTSEDVWFTPNNVNLETDSIQVNIALVNLGRSIEDTFALNVVRNFPNSTFDSTYIRQIYGLDYRDTISISMPLQPDIGLGMNEFSISVDLPSFVPEQYDEFGNNQLTKNFFINVDGILPVLPYDYAVVPEDSVVVKASTINPIASFNTYRFEIDTTDEFNSPFHRYAIKSGLGGVHEVFPNEWQLTSNNSTSPLILTDSTSYFWRVAVDSTVLNWTEHSFQYIPGKTGWGQDHFFQFKNGGFAGIEYDRPNRKRNFTTLEAEISCDVYDNANSAAEFNETLWRINGQVAEYNLCSTPPSIHVAVIDPSNMEPWGTNYDGLNTDNSFGNVNDNGACRNRVEYYFIFRQNTAAQLQALESMLLNEIPNGHYVLIYTARNAQFGNWQSLHPSLFTTFQSIGSDSIYVGQDDRAFIMLTRMGDPGSTEEMIAQQPDEFLSFNSTIQGLSNIGQETSTIIGPAANWNTLYWKQDAEETNSDDETRLIIKGLDINQNVQLEIDTLFTANDSILNLNSLVDASQYPYLQLAAEYSDSTTLTPAQVDRWHVLYERLPEAAIDGINDYVFLPNDPDSLQEGVEKTFAVDIRNISDLDMDSLLVHYWVTDQNQVIHPIPYERQDSLKAGEILRDTLRFSTEGLAGENTLWMEVNPYVNGSQNQFKDQPELAHFNNLLQIPFSLEQDDINPILDVTFDGQHILNGDIVNPNAEVVITLKDENPFLLMDEDADTSNFGIFLTDPSGEQKSIPFIDGQGNQIMQWIPADGSNLKFKIIYNGEFDQSGTYELLVQGSDNSGNLSGDLEYRIQFEVILESTITHIMNYPNPFSTSTRFVFTLTGQQVPDEMIIQIMTVTGRVVREITEDELGPIRIGRNVTEYAWDGRDEFGDPLANGVYVYRVKARINGEPIEHRESGADQHFERNWGKMYLMR